MTCMVMYMNGARTGMIKNFTESRRQKKNPLCKDSSSGWRVVRGGSWDRDSWYLRCANRFRKTPVYRSSDYGFRLIRLPQDR